ncbi:MAG TPA: hypothetical protein VIV35_04770 [Chitinophagaceae bacterium]
MKNYILPFLCYLFSAGFVCSAQTKYGIKNIYAYYTEHLPGIIPVDKDGNSLYKGPDTLNTVYIEANSNPVQWKQAWKNGKVYSINTTLITTIPFEAGTKKMNDEKILLTVAKGCQLWQLTLVPAKMKPGLPKKLKPGEIMLQGNYAGKTISQKITGQTELLSLPSY